MDRGEWAEAADRLTLALGTIEAQRLHDYLIRPDDLLGHLGVQDRPHVSTTVVSTALAAGPLCPVNP